MQKHLQKQTSLLDFCQVTSIKLNFTCVVLIYFCFNPTLLLPEIQENIEGLIKACCLFLQMKIILKIHKNRLNQSCV